MKTRRLVQVSPNNATGERFRFQSGTVYERRANGSLYRLSPLKKTCVRKMGKRAKKRYGRRMGYLQALQVSGKLKKAK